MNTILFENASFSRYLTLQFPLLNYEFFFIFSQEYNRTSCSFDFVAGISRFSISVNIDEIL